MERAARHHVSPPAAAVVPRPPAPPRSQRARKPRPAAGEDASARTARSSAAPSAGSDYDGEAAAWQSSLRGARGGRGGAKGTSTAMAAAAAAASAGDFAVDGRRKGGRRAKARAAAAAAAAPKKKRTFWQKLAKTTRQWKTLSAAPRELWIIFALKFAQSYSYFSFALVLTLFLSQEHGVSDTTAGWTYGAYGVMSTFFGLIGGWAIDYLGVRLSLVLGAVLGSIARFILAFSRSRRTAMLVLYTLLPASDACGIPIMTIGVKRFTNSSNRTFAFSFFYSMMNLAALTAGPLVDAARQLAGGGVQYTGTILWWHDVDISLSPLRLVVFSGGVATLLMLTVVFTGVREVEVGDDGVVREFAPNRDTPMEQTMAVLRSEAFWRLSLFTFLLVGVRLVFRHMDATMPKVLVRTVVVGGGGALFPWGCRCVAECCLVVQWPTSDSLLALNCLLSLRLSFFRRAGSLVWAIRTIWPHLLDQPFPHHLPRAGCGAPHSARGLVHHDPRRRDHFGFVPVLDVARGLVLVHDFVHGHALGGRGTLCDGLLGWVPLRDGACRRAGRALFLAKHEEHERLTNNSPSVPATWCRACLRRLVHG